MTIDADFLVCTSCWTERVDWPDGKCPNCSTTHQPLVMSPIVYRVYDRMRGAL